MSVCHARGQGPGGVLLKGGDADWTPSAPSCPSATPCASPTSSVSRPPEALRKQLQNVSMVACGCSARIASGHPSAGEARDRLAHARAKRRIVHAGARACRRPAASE